VLFLITWNGTLGRELLEWAVLTEPIEELPLVMLAYTPVFVLLLAVGHLALARVFLELRPVDEG